MLSSGPRGLGHEGLTLASEVKSLALALALRGLAVTSRLKIIPIFEHKIVVIQKFCACKILNDCLVV